MVFISRNLEVVCHVSDDVLVMYQGEVLDFGDVGDVSENSTSDYTRRLLDSLPGASGFDIGWVAVVDSHGHGNQATRPSIGHPHDPLSWSMLASFRTVVVFGTASLQMVLAEVRRCLT